jgi:hypothetical protein
VPDPSATIVVLDRLIDRHDLCPSAALGVLVRAARRNGCSVEVLAARITGATLDLRLPVPA